jgi:hypothetical protein
MLSEASFLSGLSNKRSDGSSRKIFKLPSESLKITGLFSHDNYRVSYA